MKSEKNQKVFVRYKNLNEPPTYNKQRTEKRPYDKKKYAQKASRAKQALKMIYESFQPTTEMPAYIRKLLETYPKFFNKQGKTPQKESTDSLNDYLISNRNKISDFSKEPRKQVQHQSSSEPDWNSDDEIDSDMESKKIDQKIIVKVVQKLSDKQVKKAENLKPHERRFLQDYYREKRILEQQRQTQHQSPNNPTQDSKNITKQDGKNQLSSDSRQSSKKNPTQGNEESKTQKPKENIWSQYQNRQVNTFVNLGFMTKIEDNEQEITAEVVQDDGMFNEDFQEENQGKIASQPSEESQEQDDIFGDQDPITTTVMNKKEVQTPKVESQKKITQGTVVVKDHLFSKIAEMVGLLPVRCLWIIKNEFQKFKVTTDYMDAYYRKEKMYEILPLISLNHSEYVSNQKVETPQGLEVLKNYNYRLNNPRSYPNKAYQYHKEKQFTHHKKK